MTTSSCIVCKEQSAEEFMDYGMIPLGNAFLKMPNVANEYKCNMRVAVCTKCNTVQQTAPPDFKFLEQDYRNYRYAPTKSSQAQVKNLNQIGNEIVDFFKLDKKSLLLDIGCNDGAMLAAIKDKCQVLGVEPARDIGQIARNAIDTEADKKVGKSRIINEFFERKVADQIVRDYGMVDVVTFTQVFQHLLDPNGCLENVARVLRPGGGLVIEGRYFTDTLVTCAYDTMYPEIITCATLTGMINMLARHGIKVVHAQMVPIYGGSLRVYAKKDMVAKPDETVASMLAEEERIEIRTMVPFKKFAENSKKLRDQLRKEIDSVRTSGGTIAGYAAPSTGATILNYAGLWNGELKYIVDDSDLKQGTFAPGTHQPVLPSETLAKDPVSHILLIAWRLGPEIFPKIEKYGVKKVIIPLPKVEILQK